MTEMEYLKELERLTDERNKADLIALQMQEPYRNALRKVDMIKEQIRQLQSAWINEKQFTKQGFDATTMTKEEFDAAMHP